MKDHYYYIAWSLVIIGWGINIWNSNRIARRSDIRSICERSIKYLDELHHTAQAIWKDNTSDEDSADMKISLQLSIIEIITRQANTFDKIVILKPKTIANLRDKLLADLSPSNPENFISDRLNEIDFLLLLAIEDVETNYHKIYAASSFKNRIIKYSAAFGALFATATLYLTYKLAGVLTRQ